MNYALFDKITRKQLYPPWLELEVSQVTATFSWTTSITKLLIGKQCIIDFGQDALNSTCYGGFRD